MTKRFTVTARARSFLHAFRGIGTLLRTEHNAWIHAAATVVVTAAGLLVGLEAVEWGLIVLAIALVFSAESFNTALEVLADAVHPDPHPLVGRAKDLAAGAVLLAAMGAVVIALLVFVPHIRG